MIWFSKLLWSNVCQNRRKAEVNKKNELKSDPTTILIQKTTEEGLEEEYKWTFDSPSYYYLCWLLSSDIYIISDIVCGNKQHIILMTIKDLRMDNQLQCTVGLTFITGTRGFMKKTLSTSNDQIKTFNCSPGGIHYPLIEAIYKNPPPNHNKNQKKNFQQLW